MSSPQVGARNHEDAGGSEATKDVQETTASNTAYRVNKKVPKVGMDFLSEEEAYSFYNNYAEDISFSVRKGSKHYVKNTSTIQQRTFFCSRQGARREDKREDTFKYSRPESRCGCGAHMKISLRNGLYHVYEFDETHNHTLATGDMTQYLRSHRKVTEAQIASAEVAKAVGISNKATIDLMAKQAGGIGNLGCTREDMKNRLYTKRTLQAKQGDTGGVLEYMAKKVAEDPKFFYSIQVDADDLITNIFWADSKMVEDYATFGDVICFDTTYRKLDDGRPFGLIVGVNNHKKTVVFGAALLYDETAESFGWLFRTFLNAMSGKHPQTILTDEDAAMAKAISIVLPHSHHKLCVWHMNQNACKHLGGVVPEYKKFNADFQHCIYDIEEEDEFIISWNEMLDKYGLHENEWLQRWFTKREHWAQVYGRNTFSAHMSTTQRSESMNNELKRYISIKYDMLTFFHHFERLVADKRFEELRCDFKATQTTPKLKTESSYILRQAAATYTPAIFKMFHEQVLRTLNYDTFICDDSDTEHKVYKVNFHGTQRVHVVRFFREEEKINCSCKRFEFEGILCSHCLKVLDINNIKHIPEQYILKRWTIGAKVLDITGNRNQHDDPRAKMSNRYKELCRIFMKIAARAAESDESYNEAVNCAEKLAQDVEKSLKLRTDPDLGNPSTPQVTGLEIDATRISKHSSTPEVTGLEIDATRISKLSSTPEAKGLEIDASRISKHNEGLAKPIGIKVKDKSVRGSRRPISGFEKATKKKKKSKNASVQPQPQSTTTGHLEFTPGYQMGSYQLQYNPFLHASMQQSLGNTILMQPQNQSELGRLQPYNTRMGPPTNQMYTYLPQHNSLNSSQQQTMGTSTSNMMSGQNQALFHQPMSLIGTSTSNMMTGQNQALFHQPMSSIGASTSNMMTGQNQDFFHQPKSSVGTSTSTMITGQNQAFFHQP